MFLRLTLAALAVAALLFCAPALAAQSYDNCTGFIDSIPTTIDTPGTWCLRKDVSTALTSAHAIHVDTNDVTIDCNDFKIGGLAAGSGTAARGIHASDRTNVTVRNCNVRGFYVGISLIGQVGRYLVEDNQLDSNWHTGIIAGGDGSMVRRNRVLNTGGSTHTLGKARGIAINNSVDVIDNTITNVYGVADASGNSAPYGIYGISNVYGTISGNRVRGLPVLGSGMPYGIRQDANGRLVIRNNDLTGNGTRGRAMYCSSALAKARDNIIQGFPTAGITNCTSADNVIH